MGFRIFIAMVVVLLVCLIAESMSFQAGNLGCGGLPKRPLSISIGNHGVGVSGTHGGIHAGKQHNQKNIGGHLNLPGGHTIHADHVKTRIPDAGNIHHTTVGASGPIGSGTYTVGGSKTSGAGMPVQRSISAAFEKTNRNGVSYKIEAGKDANSGKFGKISVNIPFN